MSDTYLHYQLYMQEAFRIVMARALADVARSGLAGEHHFYIEFQTTLSGVVMPGWLHEQYPEKMMIVLQNEFDELAVLEDRFSVALSFDDRPATLVIPFSAVTNFVDPSVKFGLAFEVEEDNEEDIEIDNFDAITESEAYENVEPAKKDGQVLDLDAFRKK